MPTLSVVIVTHDSRKALGATLPALAAELRGGDELIVVDNASADDTPGAARALVEAATVIEGDENLGFAAGCNRGAEAATGQLLCLLNPDARPQAGWRDAIELPVVEQRGWAAWQGLVTASGGRLINTRGGVVHFSGIAWAGGAGQPADGRDGASESGPAEPGFVSGACLAIDRELYLEHGGMAERFFLYHEDVDLSLRLRLAGGRLGVEPMARVDHDYEFAKGPEKWRYLERNRWATLIRTYPGALLVLLAPALAATELALLIVAAGGGWLPQKLSAWRQTLVALPRLVGERRRIRTGRAISAGEFARGLTSELGSAYLGRAGRSRALGLILRAYWTLVLLVLGGRR